MTIQTLNLKVIHPSWFSCVKEGLAAMDPHYLQKLSESNEWLPGPDQIFNAFSQPLMSINYVLFGESPYPRSESAYGYAFWDAAVNELWSTTGFSKQVNRATSLRNFLKMLLVAEELLNPHCLSQEDIAKLNKTKLIQTNQELFARLLQHGFLLLNTTLVLSSLPRAKEAKAWSPFIRVILGFLLKQCPQIKLILLGRIAQTIEDMTQHFVNHRLCAEHPYNISFISNHAMINFFKPFHLLLR